MSVHERVVYCVHVAFVCKSFHSPLHPLHRYAPSPCIPSSLTVFVLSERGQRRASIRSRQGERRSSVSKNAKGKGEPVVSPTSGGRRRTQLESLAESKGGVGGGRRKSTAAQMMDDNMEPIPHVAKVREVVSVLRVGECRGSFVIFVET